MYGMVCLLWCVPIGRGLVVQPPPPPERPESMYVGLEDLSPEDRGSFIARLREQELAGYRPPAPAERIFQPVLGLGYWVAFLLFAYMSRSRFDAVVASYEDDSGIADTDRAAVS